MAPRGRFVLKEAGGRVGENQKDDSGRQGRLSLVRTAAADAIKLLTSEAHRGNESAAYMLAVIYETGASVEPDGTRAREWLRHAVLLKPGVTLSRAARDCSTAATELERLLGEGVPLNALAERIAAMGRLTERLRVAVGFAEVQAGDVDSPS